MPKTKLNNLSLFLFSLIVLAPLAYLSFFNFPSADDFSYINNPDNLSFFEIHIYRYLNWTSRYFATTILILSPLSFGTENFYGIYPLIFLGLFFYSIRNLLISIKLTSNSPINLLILGIISIYTLIIPSLCENYFWLPGSATYFLPFIMLVFSLSTCIDVYHNQRKVSNYLLPVFMIVIGGSSEIIIGYTGILLFLFLFFYYAKFKKVSKYLLVNLCLISTIALFIFLSPGNAAREEINAQNLSLVQELLMSFKKVIVLNIRYLLCLFILFFALMKLFGVNAPGLERIKFIYLISGLNIILFMGIFIAIHSLGRYYPPRVENVLVLVGGIFTFLIAYKLHKSIKIPSQYVLAGLPLFFCLYMISSINPYSNQNNFLLMYNDIISGKPIKFQEELKERKKIIENCAKDCTVPKLKNHPRSFYFKDITSDRDNYINRGVAHFYKLNSIKN